jgi:uncharacterized membrane protein
MDLGILLGVVLLAVWAIGALMYDGPGWIHLLLTVGVTLVIYRIVVRGTPVREEVAGRKENK